MKKLLQTIAYVLMAVLLLPTCQKDEDPVIDNSLIIVKASGNHYAIISPATSRVLHEVTPALPAGQIDQLALSYLSQKVVMTSKEPGGTYVKLIYTCDRETGQNLVPITFKHQWDVQSLSTSAFFPEIVFHGHPANGGLQNSSIFRIDINGANLQQLTQNKELVEGIELWWGERPSWSPEGQLIAFKGTMRTPDPGAYWWGKSIVLMDAHGGNKRILYNEPDANSGDHRDISWTPDGQFLIFLTNEYYSSPRERVKVLNVATKELMDITNDLLVDGKHTSNLCTSPLDHKILFNKHQPGGGDLHEIDYEITPSGEFRIKGRYRVKRRVESGALAFGAPHWQIWPGDL